MSSRTLPVQAKELFQYLFEQASLGIAVEDMEGTLLLANPALCSMLGYREDELCGMSCSQFASPEDSQDDWALFQKLCSGAIDQYSLEKRYLRKDGTPLWGRLNVSLLKATDGGSTLVFAFVEDITDRKRTEETIKRSESNYHLFVSQSSEGIFCQELDRPIPVGLPEDEQIQRILHESHLGECNEALARMYGISPSDFVGKRLTETVDAKDPVNIELTRDYIRGGYRAVDRESHEVDSQGNPRVFLNSMFGIIENGMLLRTWGIQRDITARRQAEQAHVRAEQALRESEERFRLAAQSGKMYAYEWDVASDAVIRSAEHVNVLGFSDPAKQLTRQQLLASIHQEDRAMFVTSVEQLTPQNPAMQISYRVLRPDGSVIWVEKSARGFFDQQGKLLRMIGMVVDITERKQADKALASLSRRLIAAQEQERTRIGRELHDDIGQRIALLAVELQQLHQDTPNLPEIRNRIGALRRQTSEIAVDIQSLSHELHSAKLQYLGLGAAMRAFCQEFGAQRKVKVDFSTQYLPSPLSPDICLCLFRVLQESLHNAAKHSGAPHIEVRLWGMSDEIHLTVSDSGLGFDSEVAKASPGLGLVSMEERLKLVGGELSIESKPQRGTRVHARVPRNSETDSMPVAG
jgi:PAS domain S-box-containing protein